MENILLIIALQLYYSKMENMWIVSRLKMTLKDQLKKLKNIYKFKKLLTMDIAEIDAVSVLKILLFIFKD